MTTETKHWIVRVTGVACLGTACVLFFAFRTTKDPLVGVLFSAYGLALSVVPKHWGRRACGLILLVDGIIHVLFGVLAGIFFAGSPIPETDFSGLVLLGSLWGAYGLSVFLRWPIARGWAWPVLGFLELGIEPLALALVGFGIVFTWYFRGVEETGTPLGVR